jgi:two-component system, response regulator YesN
MMYDLVIIDDEAIMLEGLTEFIKWSQLGFNVKRTFSSGELAIEYLKTERVDVVLTDIQMDNVSGIDIARFLYETENPARIVFLSAYRDFEYARKAITYKVMYYLLKPIQIDEVKTLFTQIREKLDLETADGTGNGRQRKNQPGNAARHDLDKFNNLFTTYIKAGNIDGVLCLFDEFTGYLGTLDSEEAKSKLAYFTDLVIQKMDENGMTHQGLEHGSIPENETLENLARYVKEMLNRVSQSFVDSRVPFERQIIDKALLFINENYSADISLENIAGHVYLSPGYFSRLFKSVTGINYIDALTRVRIEKAMELLKDPQYAVYQIGSLVSYRNTKYFYKIFKKYTGYTPSEYRKKCVK